MLILTKFEITLLLPVLLPSRVWLFATTWTAARQASLSLTTSWNLLRPMSIQSVMPSNHHPLLPLLLPLIFPSIRVFSKESVLPIRWPKYLASASVLPVNIQGWFPIRIDWFDLIAVQGTLKSFLQHHSSKASVHQLSFLYGPTLTSIHDYWKNHSFDSIGIVLTK